MIYAFDFWVTLTHSAPTRELARRLYVEGNEIHIVSAISPGLPLDNDAAYATMLEQLQVPFTAIHRVDHVAEQKVEVLKKIHAVEFWDDMPNYVEAATAAGVKSNLVVV
jgi:hypothetical protein